MKSLTSYTIIRKFNALDGETVSKKLVENLLDDVNQFIKSKRIDSHGPEGEKILNIRERLSKLLPKVNGQEFKLRIEPKVKIHTPKSLSGTYDQYIIAKNKFEKSLNDLTDKLNKFPKHPNGLVKDRTPEYINTKKEYDRVFQLYKSFNSLPENKKYSKRFFDEKRKKQLLKAKRTNFKPKSRGKKLSGTTVLKKIKPGVYEFISSNGDKYVATSTSKNKKTNFDITRNGKMIDNGAAKISDIRSVIALEIRNSKKGLSGKKYNIRVGNKTARVEADSRKEALLKTKVGLKIMKASGKKLDKDSLKLIDPTKVKASKNLSGVSYNYKEINLGDFKKDFHKMFSDTIVQIHGLPGHGKTVYVLKIAQDRASRTGDHVLYVAHEEFGRSTLDLKLKEQNIGHKNLRIRGNLTDTDATWATVIILDSVNSLDLTSKGVKHLTEKFPNKNWFLILQSTKDGKFRGDQTWEHLVDIAGEVRDRKLILSKNRLDPDNKDKAAKLRMDALINEKTQAARIREKVKYEATKDKLEQL